jgi:cation transport ATPase
MQRRWVAYLCVALAAVGWIGLGYFTYNNPPTGGNRWIAVAALWPTVLFTILPPIVWLHQRLGDGDGAMARPLRQSALAALYLSICVWLRMVRALNWANASLLLILFVLTDVLLVSRSSG